MISDLVRRNRSCRRFHQEHPVQTDALRDLVDLGRLSASGANRQPLKYIICNHPDQNEMIFRTLAWAAYLKDWSGPVEGEKPAAYIIILADAAISSDPGCDHGIAAQSILLGAREKGLAGCILGTIKRPQLRDALHIDEKFEILLAVALGKPAEEVVIEPLHGQDSVKYWRDAEGVHHVPKRMLADIIVAEYE
jgi:nitroreductase